MADVEIDCSRPSPPRPAWADGEKDPVELRHDAEFHPNILKQVLLPATEPVIKKKKPCFFFRNGTCTKGAECPYGHELPEDGSVTATKEKQKPICSFFSRGTCTKGAKCSFSHELPGDGSASSAPPPSTPPTPPGKLPTPKAAKPPTLCRLSEKVGDKVYHYCTKEGCTFSHGSATMEQRKAAADYKKKQRKDKPAAPRSAGGASAPRPVALAQADLAVAKAKAEVAKAEAALANAMAAAANRT